MMTKKEAKAIASPMMLRTLAVKKRRKVCEKLRAKVFMWLFTILRFTIYDFFSPQITQIF